MEGWTELQFDIRATYKGSLNDVHAIVIERCEGLFGSCMYQAKEYIVHC